MWGLLMKSLGEFDLQFKSDRSKKIIPVEVLVDQENTIVLLDCSCCLELISSRLPGGIMIPIASTLKEFFKIHGMRNLGVRVSGNMMRRTYRGIIDAEQVPIMKKELDKRVSKFSKKRQE